MSDNTSKNSSKLGSNPLGGGALDWLDDEPASSAPQSQHNEPLATQTVPAGETPPPVSNSGQEGRGGAEVDSRDRADSTRRGVAAGYRRHTLLMREDQIDQLDRLYALEKLHARSQARTKKDIVEEAFDLFFQSGSSEPRGVE